LILRREYFALLLIHIIGIIRQNTLPTAEDFQRYGYNGKIAGSASFQKNRNRRRKRLESEQALAPASISKATLIKYSDGGSSEKPCYDEDQNSGEGEDDENMHSRSPEHMPSGQYRRFKRLMYTQNETSQYRREEDRGGEGEDCDGSGDDGDQSILSRKRLQSEGSHTISKVGAYTQSKITNYIQH
jgi:hypothetical protein